MSGVRTEHGGRDIRFCLVMVHVREEFHGYGMGTGVYASASMIPTRIWRTRERVRDMIVSEAL